MENQNKAISETILLDMNLYTIHKTCLEELHLISK